MHHAAAQPRRRSRAFTLVEIIVVLTIIIILLAIAIPTISSMMGNNSLAAAQNQIAAALGNARADAMFNRQMIGICFFVDPATNRTAMAEVQVQSLWQGTTASSQFVPDTESGNTYNPVVPNNGLVYSIELVNNASGSYYRDIVELPKGIGIALTNNTYGYNYNDLYNNPNPAGNTIGPVDRYVRLGCIMFGPDGTLTTIPFGIPRLQYMSQSSTQADNLLYDKIIPPAIAPANFTDIGSLYLAPSGSTPQQIPLTSSVGMVIYDRDLYLNQKATSIQIGSSATTGTGASFDEYDINIPVLNHIATTSNNPVTAADNSANKYIEENWLDQNGTSLLVSPFNGSLIKAR